MVRRQHVVADFFAEAEAMREAIDAPFKTPYAQNVLWQYFCVPRLYTYLRTAPEAVIPEALFMRFMQHLRLWCMEQLGMAPTNTPALHLMVNGCKLELHSDFHNGVWGYVYSLTRWQHRRFSGGETALMRDGVPSYKKHQVHGDALYELIPAHFNQLLVFDDRIVHGTPVIEGSMDPLEGRIALVGHLRATSPRVTGYLDPTDARAVLMEALASLRDQIRSYKDVQGTVTCRLEIAPSGAVVSTAILTDNLVTPATGYELSDGVLAVKALIQKTLTKLRFSAAAGKSSITLAVLVPVPDLRPIEIAIPHSLSPELLREWAVANIGEGARWGLRGSWQAAVCVVEEPIPGSVRIEAGHIVARFDAPMWVPSQRDQFRESLTEHMRSAISVAKPPIS